MIMAVVQCHARISYPIHKLESIPQIALSCILRATQNKFPFEQTMKMDRALHIPYQARV